MGLFAQPPAPPPPPPLPPAANPQTIASGSVQQAGARARMAKASGQGFNGTDLSKPLGTGQGPLAKAQLLGDTSNT